MGHRRHRTSDGVPVARAPLLQNRQGDRRGWISGFRHWRKSYRFGLGYGIDARRSIFWQRSRPVGSGACIGKRSARLPDGGANTRPCGGSPVRGNGLPHLRRRTDHGLVAAASFLCLSCPGRDVRGVDCDAVEGRCRGGSSVRVTLSGQSCNHKRRGTSLKVQRDSAETIDLISDFAFAPSRNDGSPTLPSVIRRASDAREPVGLRGSRRTRESALGQDRRLPDDVNPGAVKLRDSSGRLPRYQGVVHNRSRPRPVVRTPGLAARKLPFDWTRYDPGYSPHAERRKRLRHAS